MSVIKILPLNKPVIKIIIIPGSKSYTNRALILAALTEKKVKLKNPLFSDDTKAMISCLNKLGIKITLSKNKIIVSGNFKDVKDKTYKLNANLSGTTIRFILALCCIIPGIKILQGKEGLNKRPIGDLVDVLQQLGANIEYLDREGFPPLKITTSELKSENASINGEISSQFLSAVLMMLPIIGNATINVIGRQISRSYVDMTINSIKEFGVKIVNKNYKKYKILDDQQYDIKEYNVEGDYSGAAYFAAIAVLTGSKITLKNLNPKSIQGDREFLNILKMMGNVVIFENNQVTVIGKSIKPVKVNMENCPDQVQTLAVLAAFAKGTTIINGVRSLRVKETERVKALEQELVKMGIKTESGHDTLIIYGGNPKPAVINTYGDHRMAMSFAVAGTKLNGIMINNPEVVSKTFPDFWNKLKLIDVKIQRVNNKNRNIVLIGMRGCGKTTVTKLLAKRLGKQYLDSDELLEGKLKMSIPEIVKIYGWKYFREQECFIVKKVSKNKDKIISTGGGVILKSSNMEALKKRGIIIFLQASIGTLLKRINRSVFRPPLTNKKSIKEEVGQLFKQRQGLYKNAADIIIKTDNQTLDEVVDNILDQLQRRIDS